MLNTGTYASLSLPRPTIDYCNLYHMQSLPAMLYGIFITSALCYFLVTWSNKYLPSTMVAAFRPIQVYYNYILLYSVNPVLHTPCMELDQVSRSTRHSHFRGEYNNML